MGPPPSGLRVSLPWAREGRKDLCAWVLNPELETVLSTAAAPSLHPFPFPASTHLAALLTWADHEVAQG